VNAPLFAERLKYNGLGLQKMAKAIEDYTWRGADFVLPVTEVLAGMIEDAKVPRKRIHVIPNGINLRRFEHTPGGEEAKARLGLDGKFVLGFAGFVREWHGLDRVLDFLAEENREDQHLLLVGDGPARQSLLEKARELGVSESVTITGIVMRDSVADYLAAFDIALQPNVVPYASPLKLFEYLALGHAIVAPATQNICEVLVNGDNALLFEPESDAQFSDCIRTLRDDGELRMQMGLRAKATISERGLTWSVNARRVRDLFRDAIGLDAA
jgi:glycosyltransferase involved in cell wall biosynthesis